MAVWTQVKVPRGRGLSLRLYACSVRDTTAPLQQQLPLAALNKCYTPLPFSFIFWKSI